MTTDSSSPTRSASDAFRISENRYRRLFETARDGILLLNAETAQIDDVNPYLVELLGYSHAEFLGKKLWEVGAFADIQESKHMFAVLQDKGYVRYRNLPLKARSGRRVGVEFVSNSYDCGGTKVIQCNIRDMSASIEADRVLQEFKAIVDASEDAIISKSLDGRIKSWNAGAERLFGYTSKEAIGASIVIIIPPDRLNEETAIVARLTRGERVEAFETLRVHKDGRLIDVSATISPIRDDDGTVVGASKIARNITARKLAESARRSLEAQLRESQKTEAIGTLAGGIAHDFNNIIATIMGNVDLALDDTVDNPAAYRSIDEIRKAARRARDLVQQILSFSRRQPTERKPIALADVVGESIRLMRATFPARVQIHAYCEPNVPAVMADATQIEQALLNLATNSMQAALGESQLIDIRLDTVMLDASFATEDPALTAMRLTRPALAVRLSVSDTGPGMDESIRARMFEPFFTTKPVGEGTGLGLSVVRGIVHAHEGAVVAASQPGKGTTFTMYLPVAPAARVSANPIPNSELEGAPLIGGLGRRLLYIDDNEALVRLMGRLLERHDYIVTGFTDARKAIEALRANPSKFDLVVCDYNMPYLSGLDAARAIRDIRADLPVAVASGFIDEKLLQQARSCGVRELIIKPIDTIGLLAALHRLAETVTNADSAAGAA